MSPVMPTLRVVQKVTLSEAVIAEILEQIKSGALAPGDSLPPEKELIKQLGVSRPVLREALRSLSMVNAIEIRPGHGAVVKDVQQAALINSDVLGLTLGRGSELEQLHEARGVVEPAIAGMAAQRASDADFERLQACVDRLRDAGSRQQAVDYARAFHVALAEAGHNPLLQQMIMPIFALLDDYIAERGGPLFTLADEHRIHAELLEVIRRRDPQAARAKMREHLEISFGRWYTQHEE